MRCKNVSRTRLGEFCEASVGVTTGLQADEIIRVIHFQRRPVDEATQGVVVGRELDANVVVQTEEIDLALWQLFKALFNLWRPKGFRGGGFPRVVLTGRCCRCGGGGVPPRSVGAVATIAAVSGAVETAVALPVANLIQKAIGHRFAVAIDVDRGCARNQQYGRGCREHDAAKHCICTGQTETLVLTVVVAGLCR